MNYLSVSHQLSRLYSAIPSVSGDASYRPDVFAMGQWLFTAMKALGIE